MGLSRQLPDGQCYGMTEQQILDLYKEARRLSECHRAQEIRDEHFALPRRIYVNPIRSLHRSKSLRAIKG